MVIAPLRHILVNSSEEGGYVNIFTLIFRIAGSV